MKRGRRIVLAHHESTVREMAAAGSSDREIAAAIGKSEKQVSNFRMYLGVPGGRTARLLRDPDALSPIVFAKEEPGEGSSAPKTFADRRESEWTRLLAGRRFNDPYPRSL